MCHFKYIPGYEEIYSISQDGEVYSHRSQKFMKSRTDRYGYLDIQLCVNYKAQRHKIHRLVAITYLGQSDLLVNHKNGIKSDNRLENLEYCTYSENAIHRVRVLGKDGGCFTSENNPRKK